MARVDLTGFSDERGFVLVLGGTDGAISAKSLTNIVGGLNGLARAIGRVVDPAYEIEVELLDVRPGSTKVRVRLKKVLRHTAAAAAMYAAAHVLPPPRDIIGGLVSSYLYDIIKSQEPCTIRQLAGGATHVKGKNCDVVVDNDVYEASERIHYNRSVAKAAKRLVKAVEKDQTVTSLGIAQSPEEQPKFQITRRDFDRTIDLLDNPFKDEYLGNGTYLNLSSVTRYAPDGRKELVQADLSVIRKARS